jgi:hypothetical protein
LIANVIDLSNETFVIYNTFDLKTHVARMREKHPNWSDKQLYCCLYWQGTARKQLRHEIELFTLEHLDLKIVGIPEACGVNVTETMARAGFVLEWPPVDVAYQIVVAGHEIEGER